MEFPGNCKYTSDHEWVRIVDNNIALVGITDFAQGELGELVYVEVGTVGSSVAAGAIFGTVEAVKTTSDLFMPVSGEVLELNADLDAHPELINESPYDKGWIIKIAVGNLSDVEALMDAQAYKEHIGQ